MPETAAAATAMPEWQLILLTALVTTIGTAFVSYVSHLWTVRSDSKAERERHARYLAIRVVCVLDPFVSECGDVVYDTGMPEHDGTMHPRVGTPKLAFPEDVDWRAVDPDLMYRILGFPNEIAIADQAIDWVVEQIAGPPDYNEFFDERIIRYGKLGLAAMQLADDLRKRYGIPAKNYGDWNPREVMTEKVAEAEKDKAERDAENAEMLKEMWERREAAKAADAEAAKKPEAS